MAAPGSTWRVTGAAQRRPAVAVALLVILGIVAQNWFPLQPAIVIGIAVTVALLLAGTLAGRRGWISCACIAAAIFFVALISAELDSFYFQRNQIGLFTGAGEQLADLEMQIVQPPHLSGGMAEMRNLPFKQLATADVTAIQTRAGWQPATGRITVSLEPPLDQLQVGQTLRALGWLSRPVPPANPGQFDYAQYDRRRRILAGFRITRSEGVEIVHQAGWMPLMHLRQLAREKLAAGFSPDRAVDAAFLRMLLLGDADPQVNDVREEFYLTGTAYLLSISGLHIAILGGAVLLLLRLLRVGPRTALWVSLAFVVLYAAVALPSQSGVRSLVMCCAAGVGVMSGRIGDGLQSLAVAAAAILLVYPADLYDAGFQIGAAAVLGLILFAPHVGLFLSSLWRSDDPWAARPAPGNLLMTLARGAARLAWTTLLISSVIWVTVMPLVAYHFQQTNPWSVAGGFVLLPVTIVALLGGALKILLTVICPWQAAWWAIAAAQPAGLLRHGVDWLSHLPGAAVATAAPRAWMWVVYYGLLALPLIPWRWTAARWAARAAPILACFVIVFAPAPAAAFAMGPSQTGQVRVTMLAIGAGQTGLVRVQGGQTFFVDCGSSTVADVYRRVIHPYLLEQGVHRVDDIFLSHGDYDHISAAAEIIEAYSVPMVRLTPHFRRHAAGNVAAEALLHLLDTRGPPPTLTVAGDRLDVGGGASIQVLWPPRSCDMDSNNCGMVFKLIYAGRSVLFSADIQVPPELELLKQPAQLKSDVLIAPHHGSAEASTLAFIRAVDPKFIVCSNDRMLSHKQIVFDQIAKPWPVYRTDRRGAIDITLGSDGQININTFDQNEAANEIEEPETAATP